jgi:hypothetical protein
MPLQFAELARDIRIGPFTFRVCAALPALRRQLEVLYRDFPNSESNGGFADFHVKLSRATGLRRWLWPRVVFAHDGTEHFRSMRVEEALLLFEGGLNYTIAENANFFLAVHAAAIEQGGRVAILPGASGAGKSTLTAALISRGWRLLSDELTLISLSDSTIAALARPVGLKNEAIDAIRQFAPQSEFSMLIRDTEKGTVAFLKPPAASVARMSELAAPAWIVVPRYARHASPRLSPRGKVHTFMALHDNACNQHLLGRTGFEALATIVDRCECYDFVYSEFDDAVAAFAELATRRA